MPIPRGRTDGFHGYKAASGVVNPLKNLCIVPQNSRGQNQGVLQRLSQKSDAVHQLNLS